MEFNLCLYEETKFIELFGRRVSPLLKSENIKPQTIEKHFTLNIPAWCLNKPELLFDLLSEENRNQSIYIKMLLPITLNTL